MSDRTRRVLVAAGVPVLVALLVGSAMAPHVLAAKKKPADPTVFVINANLKDGLWYDYGPFSSDGAIDDSGNATCRPEDSTMTLHGRDGRIDIVLGDPGYWDFRITGGTGIYDGLTAGGTYTIEYGKKGSKYTLEGAIDQ